MFDTPSDMEASILGVVNLLGEGPMLASTPGG